MSFLVLRPARRPPRPSFHIDPKGLTQVFRHYIRDLVYGANDGIITTFAVVAGVSGGALPRQAVLIIGVANLIADGLSMAVGNYLSIRTYESAREAQNLPEEEARPARHGAATFAAFVAAGAMPLLPYVPSELSTSRSGASTVLTLATLFAVGAARSVVTIDSWLTAGLEMLLLGVVVAAAAYGSGAIVGALVGTVP